RPLFFTRDAARSYLTQRSTIKRPTNDSLLLARSAPSTFEDTGKGNLFYFYPRQRSFPMEIKGIHHVQITIPAGAEAQARHFYCDQLGLQEIEKPDSLRSINGFWIQVGDR